MSAQPSPQERSKTDKDDGPAYIRFVTTEGERFAAVLSVTPPRSDMDSPKLKCGPFVNRSDLPADAILYELEP